MRKKGGSRSIDMRTGGLLAVDMRRMFTQKTLYIMLAFSLAIPILTLVMTSMAGGTGEEALFTNVWQAIGSLSGVGMSMDLTTMCNINLIYFLAAVLFSLFIAADFRSGFCKNLFTVRTKKTEYAISKIAVCFLCGILMLLAYFAGAMIGGAVSGLSFAMNGFGPASLLLCMLSKILLMAVFAAIYVMAGIFAKQRVWLSLLLSLCVGMFLFMIIPMMTPLDATLIHVLMCLAGGFLFAFAAGKAGGMMLRKIDIL